MPQTRNSWILWTVVACLVIAALGWFLAISPRLDDRDALVSESDDLRGANDVLDIEVAALRTQFAQLDERKAELAALQVPLPTDLDISSLVNEIIFVGESTGVVLSEVTPGVAANVVPAVVAAAPAPEPAPEPSAESTDQATEATPEPAPSSASTSDIEPLAALPITLVAYGSYDEAASFLRELQNATSRYVLVSSMTVDALVPAEETEGVPAIDEGDLKITVTAYSFAYADMTTQILEEVEAAEPVPLPVRPEGRSQFRPVEGAVPAG